MKEHFPTPQERKSDKFERLLGILRKTIMVSMMGFAATQSSASEKPTNIYPSHTETILELPQVNQESRKIILEDIQKMIVHDEFERMFLGTEKNLYQAGSGHDESGYISFDDIQKIIDQGEKSPIVAHTHPLSVYDNVGYDSKDIDAMRKEGHAPAPMPPSIVDIMSSIDTDAYFDPQDVEVREQVYDPTGTWEYTVQTDNPSIQLFSQFQTGFQENLYAALTEKDHDLLQKSNLEDKHPAKIIAILKASPTTSEIGNKLETTATTYLENLPENQQDVLTKLAEMEILGSEIASAKKTGKTDEQIKLLIDTYIQNAREIGVLVSYKNTSVIN